MSVLKTHVKMGAFASIIMAHTHANALLASEAKIAIRFSTNAMIKKKVSSYERSLTSIVG
jgi:hypothetical protein